VVHLRIVAASGKAEVVVEHLKAWLSVINVVWLPGVASRPDGDLVQCDVPREDASLVIADLRGLGLEEDGSIVVESIDTVVSRAAEEAVRLAKGTPSDAVVWEQVGARAGDDATLSATFLAFMVLAALIASVGIYLDSPILVVGAMVVGPDFGSIAGICVGIVERRPRLAGQSVLSLVVGFILAIAVTLGASLVFRATGVTPEHFSTAGHQLSATIASPGFFAFFVAFCAGIVGMLSLSTAKSGALIGVLISVTTIPAAANVAVAGAYGHAAAAWGSLRQLGVNLATMLVAGTLTLGAQRIRYARQRRSHRDRRGA
jgi:uncharacterized hydrophobic protein (TIGR00271 family)